MKGIMRYTEKTNVDELGFINDNKKVYAKPYDCNFIELNKMMELAKKENKIILSY